MKSSNIIVTAILAAASILFVWLWVWLGFNQVDSTLDIVVGVVWWAVIIIGVTAILKAEGNRRKKMRTVYLASGMLYNPEAGTKQLAPGSSASSAIASVLDGLQYGFDTAAPGQAKTGQFQYVVRSAKFSQGANAGQQAGGTWEGEVVTVATGDVRPFANKQELAAIIG